MKKTVLTIAMLVGVSTASSVVANDGMKIVNVVTLSPTADLHLQALDGLKFRLSFDNLEGKSYIALKDSKGEVLYSDFTHDAGKYVKMFDLSNLGDGNYTFEVVNGKDKVVKSLEISTNVQRKAIL